MKKGLKERKKAMLKSIDLSRDFYNPVLNTGSSPVVR
jgi:hypothetical protein